MRPVVVSAYRLGTRPDSASRVSSPPAVKSRMRSPCTTPTETGTSCRFCSRCSAVTVMVSSPVGVGALSCAAAPKLPTRARPAQARASGWRRKETREDDRPDRRRESEWEGMKCSEEASVRPARAGRQKGGELRKPPLSPKLLRFRCAAPKPGETSGFGTVTR